MVQDPYCMANVACGKTVHPDGLSYHDAVWSIVMLKTFFFLFWPHSSNLVFQLLQCLHTVSRIVIVCPCYRKFKRITLSCSKKMEYVAFHVNSSTLNLFHGESLVATPLTTVLKEIVALCYVVFHEISARHHSLFLAIWCHHLWHTIFVRCLTLYPTMLTSEEQ